MSSELGQLMQEPAGGPNHGRRTSNNPDVEGRHLPLDADEWQAREFMRDNGWTVARVKDPALSGMTGHRGALHPAEYVDHEAVAAAVEQELGFTTDQVCSVYARNAKGGPLPHSLRELRERLDARLLALSRSGANLLLLARVLGLHVKPGTNGGGGSCDAVDRALARAKTKEAKA